MAACLPAARAVTAGPMHHFFGYYDKCPWDADGRRLLAHRVSFCDRPPRADDEAVVGIVHLDRDNRFEPIGPTAAWNFQQGAMLQWLGPDHRRRVAYNRRDERSWVTVIRDLDTATERLLERPVAAIDRGGRRALGLNFARLAEMRPGYGYAGLADPGAALDRPEDDGIHLLDLASGCSRLLLSIAEIASYQGSRAAIDAKHWINHVFFNPDGSRFCLIHNWKERSGAIRSRLLSAGVDGSDLCCLADDGMASHFDWRNSQQLLAWVRKPPVTGGAGARLVSLTGRSWFRRPPVSWALQLIRRSGAVGWARQRVVGDRFLLFTDQSSVAEDVGLDVLREDGHCSYSPDGRWILMDTYPHEDHRRALFLYDTVEGRRIELGSFFSMPELESEIRCDLHARWNRDGTRVCIELQPRRQPAGVRAGHRWHAARGAFGRRARAGILTARPAGGESRPGGRDHDRAQREPRSPVGQPHDDGRDRRDRKWRRQPPDPDRRRPARPRPVQELVRSRRAHPEHRPDGQHVRPPGGHATRPGRR